MTLNLADFLYDLPKDRIAKYPLQERPQSKLLYYHNGKIAHHQFSAIAKLLPADTLLVFNDTEVIPARILLQKETGAKIEVFLLEPIRPTHVHDEVMNAKRSCVWRCMIGNSKKWSLGTELTSGTSGLKAVRTGKDTVAFEWADCRTFSDLLAKIGKLPLPPYLDREAETLDADRYQTVYSTKKGAVAAPTAGLHFTKEMIRNIQKKGVRTDYLTLHVSEGTFQPVKSVNPARHRMHSEQIRVSEKNVQNLLQTDHVIAVGTTTIRTLESLYWFGVKLKMGEKKFLIQKEDPYRLAPCSREESLERVLAYIRQKECSKIGGHTGIYIYPGYDFKLCNGLVTNFHLPASTLILLVAAFIGRDWRKVYEEALAGDYRFLSYGDCSLLIP